MGGKGGNTGKARERDEEQKTYSIGRVCGLDSGAVKEEPHRGEALALALAPRVHKLLELGTALDLEEDLVVVVRHLDVEVLGAGRRLLLLVGRGNAVVFGRHCV